MKKYLGFFLFDSIFLDYFFDAHFELEFRFCQFFSANFLGSRNYLIRFESEKFASLENNFESKKFFEKYF